MNAYLLSRQLVDNLNAYNFYIFNFFLGSGKTGGFLFPTIAKMLHSGAAPIPEHIAPRGRGMAFPNCLILAPTRELAIQVCCIYYYPSFFVVARIMKKYSFSSFSQ